MTFDEDPSENRSELELCVDEIQILQDKLRIANNIISEIKADLPKSPWIRVGDWLPKEREDVIVRLEPIKEQGCPAAYVWGYLRHPAGVKSEYYFVTTGANTNGRTITHWSRQLKDGFIESVQSLEQLLEKEDKPCGECGGCGQVQVQVQVYDEKADDYDIDVDVEKCPRCKGPVIEFEKEDKK